ncbi:aspartyl-tRNA(Asn)/glutamyl-tRNA(Gln) amidotransferase subunit B [Methanophagales archaeon]|nr:aspartyl-tRNA(Asn)/glutamyl-tRNA(Gln) amidotransferase subunit B [Methanophagales archaeon]
MEVKIGLECHAQLLTKSKLFCSCSTDYHNADPNTHVCATCLGLPGALPVVNTRAIGYAIKIALALGCEVQEETIFYRKNYYYPDLPRGFQITQYDFPIAFNGLVRIESDSGDGSKEREIRITRVHMEEDPGRLAYKGTIDSAKYSLVDYNRSGMPLVEIVTEPDLKSPKEARIFLGKLRSILEYLDVYDGDLEGAMRVDANISIEGGDRAEVKNISSYKGVERALLFEITRQKNLLRRGLNVRLETRHYDEVRGITLSMRTKEFEHDYRYFPEPDLVPICISDRVEAVRQEIPELPDEKRKRFLALYSITPEHASSLTYDLPIAVYYEAVASKIDPRLSATWIADVLKGELNYRSISMREASKRIPHDEFVTILRSLEQGVITERGATTIIRAMLDKGGKPEEIIKIKGLASMGSEETEKIIYGVLKDNKAVIADYKAGKKETLNFLVGQVMKHTQGRADPKEVSRLIRDKIESGV